MAMTQTCMNVLLAGWSTLAQADANDADPNAGAAAATGGGGGIPTVYELFMASQWINGVILLLSLVAVAMFLYMLARLSVVSFAPARFTDELTRLVLRQRFEQASQFCQNHHRLMISGICQRLIENRDKDPGVLMSIVETEGSRRADRIWARIGYLSEIAGIAPTLGLLGTVIGMIKVFFTLTTRISEGHTVGDLSAGIAEAMSTTMFGLIVAILAGVFYMIVRSRATGVLSEAEEACHTLADHVHRAAEGERGEARSSSSPQLAPARADHEEGMP